MKISQSVRLALRTVALAYLFVLVVVPIAVILYRAFEHGAGTFWGWISTPAAVSATELTLVILAIVIPVNTVFGVAVALALVRGNVPGKRVLQAVIDLPFAVSPIIVGVALIFLWGSGGWFGFVEDWGFQVIFGLPGMVLATVFVTLPFVVREVEPVLREIGIEQEQAAETLGAGWWKIFTRVTLPSIRWGVVYGVLLTIARSLGEFGAVTMVSSGYPGSSLTLTLLVQSRYTDDYNEYGAYAAATLLMLLAVIALVLMTVLSRKREGAR
jgi:sulfate transport system permease protein